MRTKPKWGYKNVYALGISGGIDTPQLDALIEEWNKRQEQEHIVSKNLFKKSILEYGMLPEEAYNKVKIAITKYITFRIHHDKSPNKAEIIEAIKILLKDVSVLHEHLTGLDDTTRDVLLMAAIDDASIEHGGRLLEALKQSKENLIDLTYYLSIGKTYCKREYKNYRISSKQARLSLANDLIDILSSYGVECSQTADKPLCSMLGLIFFLVDGRPSSMGRDIQDLANEVLE